MDLKDLSAYLTGLLRSEPEVVAAFLMGVFLTGMLVFWLRHRLFSSHDAGVESARRDAEIARRDTELARKDAQIAVFEAKLAILEARLWDEEKIVATLRRQSMLVPPPDEPTSNERLAAIEASRAELGAENQKLRQDKQSAEADASDLRAKLAQALDEVNHWAKWSKVFDEENARLAEIGSLREG